nr:regulatory protein GemA [Pseudomonas sp. SLFW]
MRLIKLIHVARRELGMEDEVFRLMLTHMESLGGATSCSALSVDNLLRVVEQLKQRGFKPRAGARRTRPLADDAQSRRIRSLWLTLHGLGAVRDSSEAALARYVMGTTRVAALQWLSTSQASQVIEQLKQWQRRVEPPQEGV